MAKIDSKGRIVLPQEVRKRLGITPGTEVEVHEEDGKAVIELEDDPEQIIERMEQLIAETSSEHGRRCHSMKRPTQLLRSTETLFGEGRRRTVMSDAGGPYLFDVGVIALAHTDAPVRDVALSYVKDAITGGIDAVVPYPALIGAHNVLTTYYGCSNADASGFYRILWTRSKSIGTAG